MAKLIWRKSLRLSQSRTGRATYAWIPEGLPSRTFAILFCAEGGWRLSVSFIIETHVPMASPQEPGLPDGITLLSRRLSLRHVRVDGIALRLWHTETFEDRLRQI